MQYVIVILLGFLATSKVGFQSAFGRENVKNSTDALAFNVFIFLTAALLFIPRIFGCSYAVWLYALVAGIFTVSYQVFYTKALSLGNISLTVLMVNSSVLVLTLFSWLFFGEPISIIRFVAIVMMVASLVICNATSKIESTERKWLIYSILATLSTSCATIVQKMFGESPFSNENRAYISCMYLLATIIGLVVLVFMNSKEKAEFKIKPRMIKYAAAVGISLALYQLVFTYGLAHIDGTFLFPAQTGVSVVFATISGVLIFKDRFTSRQIAGVILGALSLVLMNY